MTALPLAATVGEIAALIGAVVAAVLVVGLLFTLRSVNAALRALRQTTDEVRRSTAPLLVEVREAVNQANTELERVDGLLVTAESISTTVDSASKLAYLAFSNPVIKALAFTTGTGRAVRRLRRRSERPSTERPSTDGRRGEGRRGEGRRGAESPRSESRRSERRRSESRR